MSHSPLSRCSLCNKKLGLFEYKCRCEKLFCISHLQAEYHNCTFDYRTKAKEKLQKENELISGDKYKNMDRI